MTIVDEPLHLSAPLAWRLAPRLCRRDPLTGESCAWNHGFWQMLRLMGMITTPAHHRDFFAQAFAAAATGNPRPRILISGAADYSMLAHVLAGFREAGAAPEITVADLCETPLHLNRWYADRLAVAIETVCCNILEYRSARSCDMICTHSFLGQFAPPQRSELIGTWRQLLRPGGILLTVNRLRPSAADVWIGFSPEQQQAFRNAVLGKAGALRGIVEIAGDEVAKCADAYASRQGAYPIRSREELTELFARGGLAVEHLTSAPVAGIDRGKVTGPTTPGSAEYACVMARRP